MNCVPPPAGTSASTLPPIAVTSAGHAPRAGHSPRRPGEPSSGAPCRGDLVVATKTGFATVTINRGFVQAVSGQQLTIREGTNKATYKTVVLTIPSDAKVRYNGQTASLSQLTTGQRVAVLRGPKRTCATARNATP